MPNRFSLRARSLALLLPCMLAACGDDDDTGGGPGPTNTGQACDSVSQCYPELADDMLEGGEAVCLDRVEGGYCSHLCTVDAECCAVPGECPDGHPQVCSPLESAEEKYCFLSCEDAAVELVNALDGDDYCARYASAAFHCRSSGGGSENRKVCLP